MKWKRVLKSHCGTNRGGTNREKIDTEREELEKLTGNQYRIDANKDGEISDEDFRMLRRDKVSKRELRDGDTVVTHEECKEAEKKILAINKKEGGAMSFEKNVLKELGKEYGEKKLEMVVEDMIERGTIKRHKFGDLYTDEEEGDDDDDDDEE